MPNKAVSYTQVPVVAADIREIRYARLSATLMQLSATYEVKDSLGAVRNLDAYSQQVALASYPVAMATILSAINTAQGT
jgi:hypothetical protein